jgi:hypothetical protein
VGSLLPTVISLVQKTSSAAAEAGKEASKSMITQLGVQRRSVKAAWVFLMQAHAKWLSC